MKKENILNKKIFLLICEIAAVILAVGLIIFVFVSSLEGNKSGTFREQIKTVKGWELVRSSGRRTTITLPYVDSAADNEILSIEAVLPSVVKGSDCLSLRALRQNVKVYIDGELREFYESPEGIFYWSTPISNYLYIQLNPEDAGKVVRIEGLHCDRSKRTFSEVFLGEKSAIRTKYMADQLLGIVLATAFFALGLVSIFVGYALRFVVRNGMRLEYIGWAMLLIALWDLTQSDFGDFIFTNQNPINGVPAFALLIIPIHIALYLNWIQERRYQKFLSVFIAACIVNAVTWIVLSFAGVVSPRNGLEPAFAFLYGLFLFAVVSAIKDKRKFGRITYDDIMIGFCAVAIGGLVQVYNFYSPSKGSDGMFLSAGFAVLTFMAFANALRKVIRMQGEKQAALATADLKSQFLATMSHEIRTPINAIMGMNEAIIRESGEDHIVGYAQDVENAGKLLLYLVNDILDFSKLESGKMSLVYAAYGVKKLVSQSYSLVEGKAKEKGLALHIRVAEDIPSVLYGDEVRIQQVIINLLNNAIKYTDSGEITFSLSSEPVNKETVRLRISVEDTGRGIKEENIPYLFDAFTRIDEAKSRRIEGTGLGLAITSKFVQLMEGTISVNSVYGQGSEFIVEIPQRIISENAVGKFDVETEVAEEPPKTGADIVKFPGVKLLVVDDVQLNIKVVVSLLKKSEMIIDSATSGEQCLEKCKNEKYDIILLDHMMPEKDGVQTLWDLRRDKKNINIDTPVIMMTANAMNGAREEYMGLGFSDYVSKPFNLTQLQKIIEKNLKRAAKHN